MLTTLYDLAWVCPDCCLADGAFIRRVEQGKPDPTCNISKCDSCDSWTYNSRLWEVEIPPKVPTPDGHFTSYTKTITRKPSK
jgi:hypothetical protein